MKAGIYVRVSTLEQAKFGYSVEAQREKLNDYAKALNYEVIGEYVDDGFSGATMSRPQLSRLLDAVKNHQIDIVLIYKLDRLSRRVRDMLALVDIFINENVQIYSLNEQIDLTSPFGRAMLTMSATFSEMEREVIKERSILGKEQRVKKGLKMALGNKVTFGYKKIAGEKRFEIIPEEAEMVKKIYDLYVNQGMSIRQLYAYARENFKHPYFGNNMCCKAILSQPMYYGYFLYNGELYKGMNFEPIISYDLFKQAQARKKENTCHRNLPCSPYLLTGLIFCGECGCRYVGKTQVRYNKAKTKTYKDQYYGCALRVKMDKTYYKYATKGKCENKIYKASELDKIVEDAFIKLKFTGLVTTPYSLNLYDGLKAENGEYQARIEKLLDLYLDAKLSKELYEKKVGELEEYIAHNQKLIDDYKNEPIKNYNVSIEYLMRLQHDYPTASDKDKRMTLQRFIEHIIIKGDDVIIKWRVK